MKLQLAALAAALPLVCAAAAQAQITWTGELGYTRSEVDSGDVKVGLNTINLRGGAQFAKHWGAEMEVGTGLGSSDSTFQGVPYSLKMNYQVGIYAVGYLPIAKGMDLFGRVGAVGAQFHEEVLGGHGSNHENGYGIGGGVRWFPGDGKNGVRVEYTRYGLQDDLNNFGVSFVRKF
jgi:hypothetical protein